LPAVCFPRHFSGASPFSFSPRKVTRESTVGELRAAVNDQQLDRVSYGGLGRWSDGFGWIWMDLDGFGWISNGI